MAASGSAGDGGHAPQAATRQPASPPSMLQKITGAVICGAGTLPKTTGATSTSVALAQRVALTSQFNFIHICMIWALHGGLCGDYFGSAPDTHDTSFHFQTVWQELFRQPFNNKRR